MKKIYVRTILIGIFSFGGRNIYADTNVGQISLQIKRGFLTIAGTGTLNIGTISSNPENEERTIPFENPLQIKDASGLCSGHYTTLQIDDLKKGSDTITKENITLNITTKTTIAGRENPSISVGPAIYTTRGSTNPAAVHHLRTATTDCGNIGQYGTTGEIKINIPANQPSGAYRGKIYYLLIDNN